MTWGPARWVVLFGALSAASPARAAIQLTFGMSDTPITRDFDLSVTVTSDYEITGVQVAYAGQVQSMSPGWTAHIAIASLPTGPVTFTATATDVFGNSAQASADYTVVRPPVVTLSSPAVVSVARSGVRIAASCASPNRVPCTFLLLRSIDVIARTQGPVIDVVDCPGASGATVAYQLFATDSVWGLRTTINLTVLVDDSPWYVDEDQAPGEVLDWDSQRILFRGQDFEGGILDRPARSVTSLGASIGRCGPCGLSCSRCEFRGGLVPGGAVVVQDFSVVDTSSGAPRTIGLLAAPTYPFDPPAAFGARGGSVLWSECIPRTGPPCSQQTRRRYRDGGVVDFSGPWPSFGPGGELTYSASGNVFLEQVEGAPEQLTDGGADSAPSTDGTSVLFGRGQSLGLASNGAVQLIAADPTLSHAAAGDWVVFTRPGPSGVSQLWEQAPDGGQQQVTFWSESSVVEAVAPNGSFIYQRGADRWIAFPDAGGHRVGAEFGSATWAGGQWHLAMGDRLFQVGDQEDPPAACVRSGFDDAGEDAGPPGSPRCGCDGIGSGSRVAWALAVLVAATLARRLRLPGGRT